MLMLIGSHGVFVNTSHNIHLSILSQTEPLAFGRYTNLVERLIQSSHCKA